MGVNGIEFLLDVIIYTMFLTGVYLVMKKHINLLSQQFALRRRLNVMRKQTKELKPIFRYLRKLLFINYKNPPKEKSFLLILILLFMFLFILGSRNFSILSSMTIAGMGVAMPVLILILKMEMTKRKGSKEGLSLVSEIYRQYWIQNKNIFSAMEQTIKGKAQCPICKSLIYKLLLRLRNTGNPFEIKECIEQFSTSLGSVWGHMLGVCIRLSAEKGIDVSEGILDILEQLKIANTRAQERARMNSETVRMAILLVPMLYLGTMIIAYYYLDVGFLQLMKNQFLTPEGFLFFIIISFLCLANLTLLELIQNQKIDY